MAYHIDGTDLVIDGWENGNLMTFSSTDRAVLALLDNEVRLNGVTIADEEWQQLPKNNF